MSWSRRMSSSKSSPNTPGKKKKTNNRKYGTISGEVSEWLIEQPWKGCVGLVLTAGSNPALSAIFLLQIKSGREFNLPEGAGMRYGIFVDSLIHVLLVKTSDRMKKGDFIEMAEYSPVIFGVHRS